jgi:hypothetical protein
MSGWQKAAIFVSGSVIGGLALAFLGLLGAYLWRPELVATLTAERSAPSSELPASSDPNPTISTDVTL